MPYLVAFLKWPTDKTDEMVKKAIEVVKKYPEDRSLGEPVVPTAFKGGLEGMRAFLENHKNIILIGTATEIPKSMWEYKSRFWAFFEVHDVKPLNEKHFLEMMEKMARFYDGDSLLDDNKKLRKIFY